MTKVLVIGAGSIGKHHIASILKENIPIKIDVVDSSVDSLRKVMAELEPTLRSDQKLYFKTSLDEISEKNQDFVILATPSRGRLRLLKDTHEKLEPKAYLLEKLLTPNLIELMEMDSFIRENSVQAWVNCARRKYDFYLTLKRELRDGSQKMISMEMDGGDWRMGSNAIHLLDLYCFLRGSAEIYPLHHTLKLSDRPQKHAGYGELFGEMAFQGVDKSAIRIRNHEFPKPMTFGIFTDKATYLVHEQKGELQKIYFDGKNSFEKIPIRPKFQSELTGGYLRSVLDGNDVGLPSAAESICIHKAFFESLGSLFPGIDFT